MQQKRNKKRTQNTTKMHAKMLHCLTTIATWNETKTHAFLQPKTHAFLQQLPPGDATKTQQKRNKNAAKLHAKMFHHLTIIVTITPTDATKTQPKRNQNAYKSVALFYHNCNTPKRNESACVFATKKHAFFRPFVTKNATQNATKTQHKTLRFSVVKTQQKRNKNATQNTTKTKQFRLACLRGRKHRFFFKALAL